MRNGDVYKIAGMLKTGLSETDIVRFFRNRYSEEEVKRFIPQKRKPRAKPKVTEDPPLPPDVE